MFQNGSSNSTFSMTNPSSSFNSLLNDVFEIRLCLRFDFPTLYCFVLMIATLFFNSFLLRIIYKHKELQNNLSVFIISLTIMNILGALIELPLVMILNSSCT